MVLHLGFFVSLVLIELVGHGDNAVVLVSHTLCAKVFVTFGIGFHIVGEELQGLVELADGSLVVLTQPKLTGFLHEVVETGNLFGIELFLLFGFSDFLLRQLVVREDSLGSLKLHDGCVEVVLGQQSLALAHGQIVGILFVLALLQDGAYRTGLAANVFVLGEDLQSGFIFRQGLLVFLLAIVLVAGIQVGIEHLLTRTVFLDLLHGLGQFLLGGGVARLLFQSHLVIGLGADEVLGVEFLVAFTHQRLVGLGILGLNNVGTQYERSAKQQGEEYLSFHFSFL